MQLPTTSTLCREYSKLRVGTMVLRSIKTRDKYFEPAHPSQPDTPSLRPRSRQDFSLLLLRFCDNIGFFISTYN